jgi:hypothetical protein
MEGLATVRRPSRESEAHPTRNVASFPRAGKALNRREPRRARVPRFARGG